MVSTNRLVLSVTGLIPLTTPRVMESSLRTINNLLERLHASFFFYLFTAHEEFVVIGKYLTSAVFIGVSLELSGLYGWVASGWQVSKVSGDSLRLTRPLVPVLIIMIGTHVLGGLLGALMTIGPLASALQVCESVGLRIVCS